MRDWIHELLVASRSLRRTPQLAAGLTLVVALGIGGGTALFAVLDAAVLHPVPYPRPEQLVSVLASHPQRGVTGVSMTPADFLALRREAAATAGGPFAALGAYVPFGAVEMAGGEDPQRLTRALVSAGLFDALELEPEIGRRFTADEYVTSAAGVVMVSHRLWQGRLAGDRDVVGRRLVLDGIPHSVVGVLPRRLRLPGSDPDVVLPLVFAVDAARDRSSGYLGGVGRLRDDVSPAAAGAAVARIAAAIARELPAEDADLGFEVMPLGDLHARPGRGALAALLAAAALVLVIACVNVASLQLVRGLARRQEIEVRRALGATRGRVARALALEVAWIAAAGGALGLLLAHLGLRMVVDPSGIYLPANLQPQLGGRALLVACTLSIATALLAGVVPAWHSGSDATWSRSAGRSTASRRVARLQSTLVVAETVLAFVLLVAAGVLVRAYLSLGDVESGFQADGVLAFDLTLPASRYPEPAHVDAFHASLLARLSALPGVTRAGAAKEVPPAAPWSYQATVEGGARPPVQAGWELTTPGFFGALGTAVLAGRLPDGSRAAPREAVLNRSAARHLLGEADPLGARVRFNGDSYEVVAVVEDHRIAGQAALPIVYLPSAASSVPLSMRRTMSYVLRSDGDPAALAGAVRAAVRGLDRQLPLADLAPLDERLSKATAFSQPRFNARLLALLAAYGLALAALGIYATVAFMLRSSRRELAIRLALGARPQAVAARLLARALALAGGGAVLGTMAATGTAQLLRARIGGLEAPPASLMAAVGAVVLAAAVLASLRPAVRAARVDPQAVLRED